MDKIHRLALGMLLLSVSVFMLTLADFLALHDIFNEYVSQEILDFLDISLSVSLPDWTETRGEWSLVTLSWFVRIGFLPLNGLTLFLCARALRRQRPKLDESQAVENPVT